MTDTSAIHERPTAAMVAIGDELLNGRTRDANVHFLGEWLEARGIDLLEVRFVRDDEASIVAAVNDLRSQVDMVFTSGGIGPTHDDITADAIGKAFDISVGMHDEALEILKAWYAEKGETVTDRRQRMARIPQGAKLIGNTVSGAPGFIVENVHVLAGVPAIFQSMLRALGEDIKGGPAYTVYTVTGEAKESEVADGLLSLETALHGVKIGCYPGKTGKGGPLNVVCRSFDKALAKRAAEAVVGIFRALDVDACLTEGFGAQRD